jgi:hypothetical protein
MVNRISAVITNLSGLRLASSSPSRLRRVRRDEAPLPAADAGLGRPDPDYGIAIGAAILVIGLFGPDIRGLAIAAGGATLAAISAIALLARRPIAGRDALWPATRAARCDRPGHLSHSILHARPSPADGMLMVVWGFGLAGGLRLRPAGLLLRINVRGTQLGTLSVAILTVAAVILAIAAVVVGRKPSSGEGSGT